MVNVSFGENLRDKTDLCGFLCFQILEKWANLPFLVNNQKLGLNVF